MASSSVLTINGRYVLSENPYSGGMADIYQAADIKDNFKRVAVKLFKHGYIKEEILAESFKRETDSLRELKHPNIIELLDSGMDSEVGHYFLVMPWMESNLLSLLEKEPIEGWDTYWTVIGQPILEALALAHERGYIHRDVKPSNILLDSNSQIKLADFGISKIKKYFTPLVTLADFTSRPYTPLDRNYEEYTSYTYAHDVFSFGVVTLRCLTSTHLADYPDIQRALEELDVHPKIKDIIEQSVSSDPATRARNAEVLLAQIEAIQGQRKIAFSGKKETCYIRTTDKAMERLVATLKRPEQEVKKILIEDLNEACSVSPYRNRNAANKKEEFPENHYQLFGASYSYHVVAENECLTILNGKYLPSSTLEGLRERCWSPNYLYSFKKPVDISNAKRIVQELKLDTAEFEAEKQQSQAEQEKERCFRTWSDILKAKEDWEKDQGSPISYTGFENDGSRIRFELDSLPDQDIIGQPREVVRENGSSILSGEVELASDEELILYIQRGDPDQLPRKGILRFDSQAARIAINRQKSALDAIRFDRAVRPNLRELFVKPADVSIPQLVEFTDCFQALNPSQEEAVQSALGAEEFLIVEGPPGTGKTRFITEVILQTLRNNPQARILLSSQTHVALDNALERIQSQGPTLKLVRIGKDEKVAESMKPLRIEEKMAHWRQEVSQNSQAFLQKWASERKISPNDIQIATQLQELKIVTLKLETLRAEIENRQKELDELAPVDPRDNKRKRKPNLTNSSEEQIGSIEEEISDLKGKSKILRGQKEAIAEELQNISGQNSKKFQKLSSKELDSRLGQLIDLKDPEAQLLQKLLVIQADWLDRFGRTHEFNASLLKRAHVVAGTCIGMPRDVQDIEFDLCIVDEASKATATEVLVPISRSHRSILVGDSKQLPPFQNEVSGDTKFLSKYGLKPEDIQETLFDFLFERLPAGCTKSLSIQHRMVKPIGDLISQCFYEGLLQSEGPVLDANLSKVLPRPVTWLTTAALKERNEQREIPSFKNACEVSIIFNLLRELNKIGEQAKRSYEIAILTGYTAQRKLINRRLYQEINKLNFLSIECNTVDAFQGREADIAIFSLTRSNHRNELGFLNKKERLNVALSRGKLGLIIVGDHYFCRSKSTSPLNRIIDHIENNSESCCLVEAKV